MQVSLTEGSCLRFGAALFTVMNSCCRVTQAQVELQCGPAYFVSS